MSIITNPIKAIRAKCLDCMYGQVTEVKLCTCTNCALYPFRMGKNPYRKKHEYTEEEKAAMAQRFRASKKRPEK